MGAAAGLCLISRNWISSVIALVHSHSWEEVTGFAAPEHALSLDVLQSRLLSE